MKRGRELHPWSSPTAYGSWGSCLPKISFSCFQARILERQREKDHLHQLQRKMERELEDIQRETRKLNKEEWKLEERRKRQQEKERQEEKRERAQRKKWTERVKMDALQQPWTGAGLKGLLTFRSHMEMETSLQKKAMELRIEDIQLLLVARRKKKNKASSYIISVGESDEAESVVGKLSYVQISDRIRRQCWGCGWS
ncbi:hypothetical protein SRHO_G00146710 [Serrasalmus rhombeus]